MKKPTMDSLRQLVSSQQQKESQLETMPGMDSQAADWVWQKGAEIYGEQWIRENGESPSMMWVLALSKMSQAEVKTGIKVIIDTRVSWPPNLVKFLELASGINTDDAFDRFISRQDALSDIEKKTRHECGYACRNQLPADKAKALFKKVYLKWHERFKSGVDISTQHKALSKHLEGKKTDHMVEERLRVNPAKTDLEIRMDAIRSKANGNS